MPFFPTTHGNINTIPQKRAVGGFRKTEWWGMYETKQRSASVSRLKTSLNKAQQRLLTKYLQYVL